MADNKLSAKLKDESRLLRTNPFASSNALSKRRGRLVRIDGKSSGRFFSSTVTAGSHLSAQKKENRSASDACVAHSQELTPTSKKMETHRRISLVTKSSPVIKTHS